MAKELLLRIFFDILSPVPDQEEGARINWIRPIDATLYPVATETALDLDWFAHLRTRLFIATPNASAQAPRR